MGAVFDHNKFYIMQFQGGTALVVVFGGVRGRKWQSTLHILDTERWHWSQPLIKSDKQHTGQKNKGKGKRGRGNLDSGAPAARCYHSATVANEGGCIVFFGGNDGDVCFGEVEVLMLNSEEEGLNDGGVGDSWSWFKPCVVGDAPSAR
jgi:hypothetical protein